MCHRHVLPARVAARCEVQPVTEQLRADIAHRAQQFKLMKDQITGVQNMMEESRKTNEVAYKLL